MSIGGITKCRRVVIVGGGFAGVTVAQRLERLLPTGVEIVLIGADNHLVFSPLLAEVVGRSIDPLHVVVAGRQLVGRARWLKAAVTHVDLDGAHVQYASSGGGAGTLRYDHLVLACGTVVYLEQVPGLAANGYPLKSLGDAMALGNAVIARLEEAAVEPDPIQRRRLLGIVAIGGGFSGVEVIGEIADVVARTRRFYPQRAGERPRLLLLEGGDRLLPELNAPRLSRFAARALERAGVEVRLEARAAEVTSTGIRLVSGEHVAAATVVSTVGATTNPLIASLGLELDRGRLRTDPDMQATGYRDVWALGECALVPNAYDGRPSPTTAQFAIRQARQLATNLARAMAGRPTRPFRFRPLGMLACMGHQKAVGEGLGVPVSGLPAWMLWRVVYLTKLPTLRRKLEVLVDWTCKLFFASSIVQLDVSRTTGIGRAHYAAGEWVCRRGDVVDRIFIVEQGVPPVYLDEGGPPIATLKPGDPLALDAVTDGDAARHTLSVRAETALDLTTVSREEFARLARTAGAVQLGVRRTLAARQGHARLLIVAREHPELARTRVADVMHRDVCTLAPTVTLAEVVRAFRSGQPGFPVAPDGAALQGYCGLAELHDAMRSLPLPDLPLDRFMRPDPPTVSARATLVDAMLLFLREQIDAIPVVGPADSVVGLLTPADVFRPIVALVAGYAAATSPPHEKTGIDRS